MVSTTSEVMTTKTPPAGGDNKAEPPKDGEKPNGTTPEVKDDSQGKATIELKGFSRIREKKYYTDSVEICGLKWYPFFSLITYLLDYYAQNMIGDCLYSHMEMMWIISEN